MKVKTQPQAQFAPEGKYLWDPWFMGIRDETHCFFLEAVRDGNPDERHHNRVSIGHARSRDLYSWSYKGTVLKPGNKGSWDDLSIWTGFTIHHDGKFYLFYTGRSNQDFWIQKIGLAVSTDLMNFERIDCNPILDHCNRYYDHSNSSQNIIGNPPTWRDPYIFRDDDQGRWIMIFSARSNPPGLYNGCIGMAISEDLLNWEIRPPILDPRIYDEMETPQLYSTNGRFYIFFSTWKRCYSPDAPRNYQPSSGMHGYVSDKIEGPFEPVNESGLILANGDQLYSVRMAAYLRDRHMAMGWLNYGHDGQFIGRLSVPLPMMIEGDIIRVDYTS